MTRLTEPAKAKINLSLDVIGRRADGYHELASLVVFADFGDEIHLTTDRPYGLEVTGQFGEALVDGLPAGGNLLERVARHICGEGAEGQPAGPGHIELQKDLPVAAGLGGGSADAAALLRLMAQGGMVELTDVFIQETGQIFGADVPVCLLSRPAIMSGIGEQLQPLVRFPQIPVVLVNPGVGVSTAAVFKALDAPLLGEEHMVADAAEVAAGFGGVSDLLTYLNGQPNDLMAPALEIEPVIGEVIAALECAPACKLARMSGSGASCFALFEQGEEALRAAELLSADHPEWWVRAGVIEGC